MKKPNYFFQSKGTVVGELLTSLGFNQVEKQKFEQAWQMRLQARVMAKFLRQLKSEGKTKEKLEEQVELFLEKSVIVEVGIESGVMALLEGEYYLLIGEILSQLSQGKVKELKTAIGA